jgi:aminoglycoside phosphotransferase (APT) family kinase protein
MFAMTEKMYSERLGMIADEQFQAALDRFHLGRFLQAEAIPFGNFGQNVFVSSSTGEYVLRGQPHFWWQFPTEQFYARQLAERTSVPVPWPYLIDPASDIFGWSYVLMPRMAGLQLADSQVKKSLGLADRLGIAEALGGNLARMQQLTWPISGRYNAASDAVEPIELASELAWPFAPESDPELAGMQPTFVEYGELVRANLRHQVLLARRRNEAATTSDDIAWVEERIVEARDALDEPFEPCLVMGDYKEGNLVVTQREGRWRVSGVFDLMQCHFGDGEADLSRQIDEYLNEEPSLAAAFFAAYRRSRPLRPGFAARFPIYMLLDRAVLWAFFQGNGWRWWPESWTFRDWAGQYISPAAVFDQLIQPNSGT